VTLEDLKDRSLKLLTVTIPLLTLLLGGALLDRYGDLSVASSARKLYAVAVVMGVVAGLAGLGTVNWGSMYDRVRTLLRIQMATLVGLFLCLAVATVILVTSPTGDVERAVKDYYYAVDNERWDYTFEHLDSESQDLVSRDEWRQINKENADADHHIELSRMKVDVSSFGSSKADVRVQRWFKNGTYIDRSTVFVLEDGSWKHHITEWEKENVFRLYSNGQKH
jgi:hypothetical protein